MTTPDTPASRIGAYLDAVARAHPDATVIDTEAKGWLSIADLRAVLAENRDLAEKLSIATRTVATLAAQRDAMETALNTANAELHAITRCDDTFEAFLGARASRPCAREKGHAGHHRNVEGTEWWPRDHGYAPDAAARLAALPDASITVNLADWQRDMQTEADLRAARDMLRRPEDHRAFPIADWLIYSHEHGAWWKPFEHGYTHDLAEAGRYIQARAEQICRDANAYGWINGLPKEVMIEWTDDPQTAGAAIRAATGQLIAERSHAQHEAAADIQDLTLELFPDQDPT